MRTRTSSDSIRLCVSAEECSTQPAIAGRARRIYGGVQNTSESSHAEVTHNQEQRRFELLLKPGESAFITYAEEAPGVLTLTHTEVPAGYEGQGVGSRLVRGALELIRARGAKIVPACPFISSYLERKPEYRDLLR